MDYPTKTKRFQNENLVVHRVSPYHYQYRYRIYDDMNYKNSNYIEDKNKGDQSYNVEKEKMNNQHNNNQNNNRNLDISPRYDNRIPQNFKNSEMRENFLNHNNNYNYRNQNNYNDNRNVKYRTPNNESQFRNRRNFNEVSRSQQIEGNYMNRNNNIRYDNRYNNRYDNGPNNDNNYRRYDNFNYNEDEKMERINDNRGNIRRNNSDFNYINNK